MRAQPVYVTTGTPADAERGQHAGDVANERLRRHDEQRVLRLEPPRVLEVEVRDAMERDGGLAGAGAALDHDDAARRLRDQLELLLVDQRGDFGQRLVGARDAVMDAELALLAGRGDGTRRLAHAAVEHRRDLADRLRPTSPLAPLRYVPCGVPMRRRLPLRDRDVAARLDDALDATAGDLFLVVVAFFVAVVDARHRRVAPVDDLHVALRDR